MSKKIKKLLIAIIALSVFISTGIAIIAATGSPQRAPSTVGSTETFVPTSVYTRLRSLESSLIPYSSSLKPLTTTSIPFEVIDYTSSSKTYSLEGQMEYCFFGTNDPTYAAINKPSGSNGNAFNNSFKWFHTDITTIGLESKHNSRLGLAKLFKVTPKSTVSFLIAKEDTNNKGGELASARILFAEYDSNFRLLNDGAWISAQQKVTLSANTQYVAVVIRYQNGTSQVGSGMTTTVGWNSNDSLNLSDYPEAHIIFKPFNYYLDTNGNGSYTDTSDVVINRYSVEDISGNTNLKTNPTKVGYTFKNWKVGTSTYNDSNISSNWKYSENINKLKGISISDKGKETEAYYDQYFRDLYFTAVYTPNTYTVEYNSNKPSTASGSISGSTASSSHTYDEAKKLTKNGYKLTGYTFAGWYTNAACTGTKYTDEQSVLNLTSTNGGKVTLYAKWTPNNNTISFNANGGTGSMSSLTVTYDKSYTLPANAFARVGYTFLKWNTNSAGTGTVYTNKQSGTWKGTSNITLYAQWLANPYKVHYNANGGTGTMASDNVKYDASYTPKTNTFTKVGYTFAGWYDNAACTGTKYSSAFTYKRTSDLTLYAKWEPNNNTISFNANGGTGSMSSLTVTYDKAYTLPANVFARVGYTFTKWNTNSAGTGTVYTNKQSGTWKGTSNITLYAQWSANPYKVHYNANGGSGTMASDDVKYDASYTPKANTFTKVGYTFAGWYDNAACTGTKYSSAFIYKRTSDLTLYAKWEPNSNSINFNANGGTGTMSPLSVIYDKTYTLPANAFERIGYTFINWNTESNNSGSVYTDKQSGTWNGTSDITLYAQWTANSYKVHYNANGGTGTMASDDVLYDSEYTVKSNEFEKTGYYFAGWYENTECNGEKIEGSFTYKRASDLTLYAKWLPVSYIVTLDSNKPDIMTSNITFNGMPHYVMVYNSETNNHVGTVSAKGWKFLGWYDKNDVKVFDNEGCWCEGTEYFTDGKWVYPGSITVYAKWEPIKYTIKIDPNGTDVTPENSEGNPYSTEPEGEIDDIPAEYDNDVDIPDGTDLDRDGYILEGFSPDPDADEPEYLPGEHCDKPNFADEDDDDYILYAIWSPIKYTVEYDMNKADTPQYDSFRVSFDEKFTLPAGPERTGYEYLAWQIYSGANFGEYADKNNTDTDPQTSGAYYYYPDAKMSSLRDSDGVVVICAIWKHGEPDGNGGYVIPKPKWYHEPLNDEDYRIYYTDTPEFYEIGEYSALGGKYVGYYVNTNYRNDWHIHRYATIGEDAPIWYNIVEHGSEQVWYENGSIKTGSFVTANGTFITSGSNELIINGNEYKLILPYVITKDTWNDAHTSVNKVLPTDYDTNGYLVVIGDNEAPEMAGLEELKNIVGIDKSEYEEFLLNLKAKDEGSGIIYDKAEINIVNKDNDVKASIEIGKTEKQDERFRVLNWKTIDVTKKDSLMNNLFNGKYEIEYFLTDNVGNTLTSIVDSSVFDLRATMTDKNHKPITGTVLRGDGIKIQVKTFGYADALKFEFPDEWYIDEDYPMYLYVGDGVNYKEGDLIPITKDYYYEYTENDPFGMWEKEFFFILPIRANPGKENIKITAFKGDLYIGTHGIIVNDKTTSALKQLMRKLPIEVDKEHVLKDLHEHIVVIQ